MGGTLNKLNCTKNKNNAKNDNHVNIVPHTMRRKDHNTDESADDSNLLDQLETGNSPTHSREDNNSSIMNRNSSQNRLKPLNHTPALLKSSMLSPKKDSLIRQPLPSPKVPNKEDASALLKRLQGLHRNHRQKRSSENNINIKSQRQAMSSHIVPSNTLHKSSDNEYSTNHGNKPKRHHTLSGVGNQTHRKIHTLSRRRSLPRIKKKLPNDDILKLAFIKIYKDGLRNNVHTYSSDRFRLVIGSILASVKRSPPSKNEMRRLVNIMNGKPSEYKPLKGKRNNKRMVVNEKKYMDIVLKMMKIENGKQIELPKSLVAPVDDMVSYAKQFTRFDNNNSDNKNVAAANKRSNINNTDSDASILTSSSSSIAFDPNGNNTATRLTQEEELLQCRKFRLFIRTVMRSYEAKVTFLHKSYKIYSNVKKNLIGYEELHNLLTYFAPEKIYEPTLEESCLFLGVIKKASGSKMPRKTTLDNIKLNEKELMLWCLKGVYQSDHEMGAFIHRSEMHKKIYYCLQGFSHLSDKNERKRIMEIEGRFHRRKHGTEIVTQREIIKTILEEEGQNVNLADMEKYEDFFPKEGVKKQKKVSVMPIEEGLNDENV